MRFKLILAFLLLTPPTSANAARAHFTNRVWERADSTGKANRDRYAFLSDGTFIITSPYGKTTFGRWKHDGDALMIYENDRSFSAAITTLTKKNLRLKIHRWSEEIELPFVLVSEAEPDTVQRYYGFNPDAFLIGAGGSEPSWSFYIEGRRAEMRSEFKNAIYEHGSWKQIEYGTWTFVAKSADGSQTALLTIVESLTPCDDAADYVMDAHLEIGGTAWEGCALLSRFLK